MGKDQKQEMTVAESKQLECPAIKEGISISDWPPRFYGRVPKTIKMTQNVRPDFIDRSNGNMVALEDHEYPAWTNRYGAVAVIFPDGKLLGAKPVEFEVVAFFPLGADESPNPLNNPTTLQASHDRLVSELAALVKCLRNGELGDISPLMDEIFDSEDAIEKAQKFKAKST